jgi:hypothetical protein
MTERNEYVSLRTGPLHTVSVMAYCGDLIWRTASTRLITRGFSYALEQAMESMITFNLERIVIFDGVTNQSIFEIRDDDDALEALFRSCEW